MRATFLYWSIGLVSLGTLAGCGILKCGRTHHHQTCEHCGAPIKTETPKKLPSADSPKKTATTEAPKNATSTDAPKNATSTDAPIKTTNDATPKKAVNTDAPKKTPSTGPIRQATAGVLASIRKSAKKSDVAKEYRGPIDSVPVPIEKASTSDMLPEIPEVQVSKSDSTVDLPPAVFPSTSNAEFVQPMAEKTTAPRPVANATTKVAQVAAPDASKKEQTVALKSTHITYGHTENFDCITGQVQAWRKGFRLRYASIEQEDIYGGFVMLEGGSELNQLRDGQHVRLRGTLIPPTERNAAARYRVQVIEILD